MTYPDSTAGQGALNASGTFAKAHSTILVAKSKSSNGHSVAVKEERPLLGSARSCPFKFLFAILAQLQQTATAVSKF